MTDSKVKTVDQGSSNWIFLNEEISKLSRFSLLAFCSAVIFKNWLKCVYIVKKKDTGKCLYFYHTSKYVFFCYIKKKSSKIEGNIPIISLYIMKFSLCDPIFQKKNDSMKCPFWVQKALEALSSAKSTSSSWVHGIHCILFRVLFVDVFIIQSIAKRKRKGKNKHPCLTSVLTSKDVTYRPHITFLNPFHVTLHGITYYDVIEH